VVGFVRKRAKIRRLVFRGWILECSGVGKVVVRAYILGDSGANAPFYGFCVSEF
jgi:hypothetical protein